MTSAPSSSSVRCHLSLATTPSIQVLTVRACDRHHLYAHVLHIHQLLASIPVRSHATSANTRSERVQSRPFIWSVGPFIGPFTWSVGPFIGSFTWSVGPFIGSFTWSVGPFIGPFIWSVGPFIGWATKTALRRGLLHARGVGDGQGVQRRKRSEKGEEMSSRPLVLRRVLSCIGVRVLLAFDVCKRRLPLR